MVASLSRRRPRTGCANSSPQVPLREAPWVTVQIELQPDGTGGRRGVPRGPGAGPPRVFTVDPSDADPLAGTAIVRAQVDVAGAVTPGSAPRLRVDGSTLDGALRREGVATRWLSLCLPPVPGELQVTPPVVPIVSENRRLYVMTPAEGLPAVTVTMHPQPLRWVAGVLGVLLALVLVAASLVSRARRGRDSGSALPVGLALAPLVWSLTGRVRVSEPEIAELAPGSAEPSVPVH